LSAPHASTVAKQHASASVPFLWKNVPRQMKKCVPCNKVIKWPPHIGPSIKEKPAKANLSRSPLPWLKAQTNNHHHAPIVKHSGFVSIHLNLNMLYHMPAHLLAHWHTNSIRQLKAKTHYTNGFSNYAACRILTVLNC
jgi:hypothetical protein